MDPDMNMALAVSFVAWTLIYTYLMMQRLQISKAEAEVDYLDHICIRYDLRRPRLWRAFRGNFCIQLDDVLSTETVEREAGPPSRRIARFIQEVVAHPKDQTRL